MDVLHVLILIFFLPVHDDPMWDVHTFYVFLVVLRVSEKIQAISWPFIFYLGQKKVSSGPNRSINFIQF